MPNSFEQDAFVSQYRLMSNSDVVTATVDAAPPIYHYTNVETLALILSSRQIRFSRLDFVDDVTEAKSADLNDFYYLFVSCWTRTGEENLPMWNMYTPSMRGVRIQLPEMPFRLFEYEGTELGPNTKFEKPLISPIPPGEVFGDGYWVMPSVASEFPMDIAYTDDEALLFPTIRSESKEKTSIDQHRMGRFKRKAWQFQNETRFRLQIHPTVGNVHDLVIRGGKGSYEKLQELMNKPVLRNVPPPITEFFLEIDNSAFQRMTILLGPKSTNADRLIVESLLEKYCPTASLKMSAFHGSIR